MIAVFNRILKENTFFKNFSVLTVTSVLTQFLGMVIGIKIARVLSPYNFGVYNLLQLHVTIFSVVGTLGISRIIIRDIARDKMNINSLLKDSLILRLAGTVFAVLIFGVYYYFFKSYDVFLFGLVISAVTMTVAFDHFNSLAFGLEKMEFSGFVNLTSTVCWLIAIFLIPDKQLNLTFVFLLFAIFNIVKVILFLFVIRTRTNYKASLSNIDTPMNSALSLGKESLPFYYLDLFSLLSMQIPILFLEYRSGTEQIGYFNIASKILLPISIIVNTALSAIFPIVARLYERDYDRFIDIFKTMCIAISLIGIAGAFGATLFRKEIVVLLYGEKYISSSLSLSYQCWYIAIFSVVCLFGTVLGAINRQKQLGYLSFVCTIIGVPLLWYGSQFGAQYLSAAFMVATGINLILHFVVVHIYVKQKISPMFYIKISAFLVVAYLISIQVPEGLSLSLKIALFLVSSLIVSFFLYKKYFTKVKAYFQ
nr:oligosaccharide flippase family protein [uncultured Pedobacter sp.]